MMPKVPSDCMDLFIRSNAPWTLPRFSITSSCIDVSSVLSEALRLRPPEFYIRWAVSKYYKRFSSSLRCFEEWIAMGIAAPLAPPKSMPLRRNSHHCGFFFSSVWVSSFDSSTFFSIRVETVCSSVCISPKASSYEKMIFPFTSPSTSFETWRFTLQDLLSPAAIVPAKLVPPEMWPSIS